MLSLFRDARLHLRGSFYSLVGGNFDQKFMRAEVNGQLLKRQPFRFFEYKWWDVIEVLGEVGEKVMAFAVNNG